MKSHGLRAWPGLSDSPSQAQAVTRPSPRLGLAQPSPQLKAEPCTTLVGLGLVSSWFGWLV